MVITEKIWTEYHRKLLSFIKKRVNDDAVAEDILQEIFVKIHTRIDSLKDDVKLESWLYQIARNTVYDYYRSYKPSEQLPEGLVQQDVDENEVARQELGMCLEPMINMLSEKYRDTMYLSEISRMDKNEIAEKQGLSLAGARSRVQRGRFLLKGLIHECCDIELDKNNQLIDFSKKPGNNDCC